VGSFPSRSLVNLTQTLGSAGSAPAALKKAVYELALRRAGRATRREADDWFAMPDSVATSPSLASANQADDRFHALVRLDATSKSAWDALIHQVKPVLVTLGADRGALSAVRLTRLPQSSSW